MNDGDWICPDSNCGNINFARRMACYRCNKDRPDAGKKDLQKKLGTEIGKSAAEKSRGLFNADDWQCNKCTNVNWARRQTCNVCNAPKFGEVEARTGYGGGYNERGTVEYRRLSSDDEYDEFGRKKKKRSSYTPADEDVGVTAGTVHIKVPPTVLPKEKKMEFGLPQLPQQTKRKENIQCGSLSDGSVCDVAPLTKNNLMEFRKQNFQKPYNVKNHENKFQESVNTRKRHLSGGDKDQTYSSGYETSYKKRCSYNNMSGTNVRHMYNPVMENRVSSTNDISYTSSKNLPIIYTLDERIHIAATAIVYNNCKLVSQKFETFFNKPAPDFKTIFLWRQRLLTMGCLNDSHSDHRKDTEKSSTTSIECIDINSKDKNILKKVLPNPDEIKLDSESECDLIEQPAKNKYTKYSRNSSVETVILFDAPKNNTLQKSSSDIKSKTLKSVESAESDYPDTDSDPEKGNSGKFKQTLSQKSASARNSKPSQSDSDSDTPSTGEQTDYFTNYGKPKRKLKRRITSAKTLSSPKATTPAPPMPIQRYSTVCASEKSPLVTGNIYSPKLNMTPKKPRGYIETDTCSSEYVPTKIGATTKQNYQQFKDNVIKRGYWAKGNGMALNKCTDYMKTNANHNSGNNFKKSLKSNVNPIITPPKANNITKVSPISIEITLPPSNSLKNYTSSLNKIPLPETNKFGNSSRNTFDKIQNNSNSKILLPENKKLENPSRIFDLKDNNSIRNIPLPETKKFENTSRIFDIVQTNSICKNRSITDIFNTNENVPESPTKENTLQSYDEIRQRIEKEWDEEDDALYRNDDDDTFAKNKTHFHSLDENMEPHLPTYQIESLQKHSIIEENKMMNVMTERKNQLVNMLNEFEDCSEGKHGNLNEGLALQNPPMSNTSNKDNIMFNVSQRKDSTQMSPRNMLLNNEVNNIQTHNFDDVHNFIIRPHQTNNANESIQCAKNNTLRILSNIQIAPANKFETKKSTPVDLSPFGISKESTNDTFDNKTLFQMPSKLLHRPTDIPDDISNQMIIMSKNNEIQNLGQEHKQIENTLEEPLDINSSKAVETQSNQNTLHTAENLSTLLTGIDANALMLALRNIQQINQTANIVSGHTDSIKRDDNLASNKIETINLTNDEEWERDTDCEESIEQRLEKMDGNTGDTPFLGDIFDPGPIMIPPKVAKKLNLPIENPELNETDLAENGPVSVKSFKSFALPKPIMLNRLKLRVPNTQEKNKNSIKKILKKRTKKPKGEGNDNEPDDEESDDNADLSKYELWGSDEEKSNVTKPEQDAEDNGQSSKDVDNDNEHEKNGGSDEEESKSNKRSRSSSSSSSSSSTSSSSSDEATNKFDDFNLNSERESPSRVGRNKSRSRSRSPRPKPAAVARRKSRDSRSGGDSRGPDQQRDRQRRPGGDRRERRYSRDGNNYYPRGKHR